MKSIVDQLLESKEPSIRYKVRIGVLEEDPGSLPVQKLRDEIKRSSRVQALLQNRDEQGRLHPIRYPYRKWVGAHWVYLALADIGYPTGDHDLLPIRDQILDYWVDPELIEERICAEAPPTREFRGIPVIKGRARRCASQQGIALYATLALGLPDERCDQLATLLLRWQWPDGGWNCDRRPEAVQSSFWESLFPLRALSHFAKASGDQKTREAAEHAAELFLTRRLFRRVRDGQIMNKQFVTLHYPCYWHYDVLLALKVMTETGFIKDPRCGDALDLLQSKQLPHGGWPAEERFFKRVDVHASGCDLVSWGGVNKRRINEWVTADALYVLHAAGRLD